MTVIVKQMLLQMTQQKVTVSGAMHLILHTSFPSLDYHCGNEVDSVQFRETLSKSCSESEFVNLPVKALKMIFFALNL